MKNCPFCHKDDIEVVKNKYGFKMVCHSSIKIAGRKEKCGTITNEYAKKKELLEDWDNRKCLYLRNER